MSRMTTIAATTPTPQTQELGQSSPNAGTELPTPISVSARQADEQVYIPAGAINSALPGGAPRVSEGLTARYTPGHQNASYVIPGTRGDHGLSLWGVTVIFPRGTESLEEAALASCVKHLTDEYNESVAEDMRNQVNELFEQFKRETNPTDDNYIGKIEELVVQVRTTVAPIVGTGDIEMWKTFACFAEPYIVNKVIVPAHHMYISFAYEVPDVYLVTITGESQVVEYDESDPRDCEPEMVPYVETTVNGVMLSEALDNSHAQPVQDYIASLASGADGV